MAVYHYVVLTSAKAGRLEDFEHWYDTQHLQDVVKVPEIKSAKRYRLTGSLTDKLEPAPWSSLAIYVMETDDPVAVAQKLSAMAGTSAMTMTDSLDDERLKIIAQLVDEV